MKKAILGCVMFIAIISVGWAVGNQQQSGKISLTIWHNATNQSGVEPSTIDFNKANPNIEVTAAFYNTDGIKDATKIAASSRTLPDMWYNWGGTLASFFVENGLTYDLTAYSKANNWDKIFLPAMLSLSTIDGKVSGYPFALSMAGIYYRKDIFQKFNLKEPQTFAEFEKVCDTLLANGITPLASGGLYGWHLMRYLDQLVEHYAGQELHDKILLFQAPFDCDAVVQALAKLKEWSDKGYFPAGFLTADPNSTYINVFAGKCAMDIQTPGYETTIAREKQDINNFGAFPLPNDKGNRMAYWGNMVQLNVNLDSARLDACMKYLNYVYSNENANRYASGINVPLPRIDATVPADRPNSALLRDYVSKNGGFTITDQAFPTVVADALFKVQDALVNGQITPKQGASTVQAAIDTYLKTK